MHFKLGDIFDPSWVSLQEAIDTLSLKRAEAKRLGYNFYFRGKECKYGHLNFHSYGYGCIECHVNRFEDPPIESAKRLNNLIARIKTEVYFLNKNLDQLFDKDARQHPATAAECKKQGLKRFFPRYPCQHGHISLCAINREVYGQCLMCLDVLKKKFPERYLNYSRKQDHDNRKKRRERRNEQRKTSSAREKRNAQRRNRYSIDLDYRIREILRARVKGFITGENKSASALDLIGCDIKTIRMHLELKFTDGMSWENYGEWHIDHIKAISFFDLTDEEQQKECFHYKNLQPLWAFDNLSKGGTNRVKKK
ncbi:hypothetical protein OAD55_03415 [Planktomarina temperata]|nr:hypothetical protein [Planktomarina temperata]